MAAKVFGTIFVIADQQTLDCSIVRAFPWDWLDRRRLDARGGSIVSLYNAKFRP